MFAGKDIQADVLNSASVEIPHIDAKPASMTDGCVQKVSNGKVTLGVGFIIKLFSLQSETAL